MLVQRGDDQTVLRRGEGRTRAKAQFSQWKVVGAFREMSKEFFHAHRPMPAIFVQSIFRHGSRHSMDLMVVNTEYMFKIRWRRCTEWPRSSPAGACEKYCPPLSNLTTDLIINDHARPRILFDGNHSRSQML